MAIVAHQGVERLLLPNRSRLAQKPIDAMAREALPAGDDRIRVTSPKRLKQHMNVVRHHDERIEVVPLPGKMPHCLLDLETHPVFGHETTAISIVEPLLRRRAEPLVILPRDIVLPRLRMRREPGFPLRVKRLPFFRRDGVMQAERDEAGRVVAIPMRKVGVGGLDFASARVEVRR